MLILKQKTIDIIQFAGMIAFAVFCLFGSMLPRLLDYSLYRTEVFSFRFPYRSGDVYTYPVVGWLTFTLILLGLIGAGLFLLTPLIVWLLKFFAILDVFKEDENIEELTLDERVDRFIGVIEKEDDDHDDSKYQEQIGEE